MPGLLPARLALALIVAAFSLVAGEPLTLKIPLVYWRKPDEPGKFEAYLYGMRAAAKDAMEREALHAARIEIVPMDERGDAVVSQEIARKIAADVRVACVVGFSNTKRAAKAIEPVSRAGIPILSSSGGAAVFAADAGNTFFTTNFGIAGEMQYFARFATRRGYQASIAIIAANDAYSEEYIESASQVLPLRGVLRLDISKGWNGTYAPEIRAFAAAHREPGTVCILSLGADHNGRAAAALRDGGADHDLWLGRGALVGDEFYRNGGVSIERVFELSELLTGIADEGLQQFRLQHRSWFDKPGNDSYLEYAAYGYDMVAMAIAAAERILKADHPPHDIALVRDAIRRGLLQFTIRDPYIGISGIYSFDERRIGGQLANQYLLESNGLEPVPYRMQYLVNAEGRLQEVPTVFTLIEVASLSPKNLEASEYDVDLTLTLLSVEDIRFEDIDIENAATAATGDRQALYAKPIITGARRGDFVQNTYLVKGTLQAPNSIEAFPFDTQTFPIRIRPRDALAKNFLVYFGKRTQSVHRIDMDGWEVIGDWAGLNRGSFELLDDKGQRIRQFYYRSAYTIQAARDATGAVTKFLLPLAIVMLFTVFIFFLPENSANADKVGVGSNMLITVIALYFTYATIVDVPYTTIIDWAYMLALAIVLIMNIVFIFRHVPHAEPPAQPNPLIDRCYRATAITSWALFFVAIIYFVTRAL